MFNWNIVKRRLFSVPAVTLVLFVLNSETIADNQVVVVPTADDTELVLSAGKTLSDTRTASEFDVFANVVVDRETGYVWQRGNSPTNLEWNKAVEYCLDLEITSNGNELTNWRMPTLKEFTTILSFGSAQLMNTTIFTNGLANSWVATLVVKDVVPLSFRPDSRWVVSPASTHRESSIFSRTSLLEIQNEYPVRCVITQ